jgi:hypothetical protein
MANQRTSRGSILVTVVLMALPALATESAAQPPCEYRGPSETRADRGWQWSYAVGAKLTGSTRVSLSGAARPDDLRVVAEIQRDTAFNPVTKQESRESYCWFRTRLEIRSPDGAILYTDEWSTKYEDMAALLESHAVAHPADYFLRFGRHTGGDFRSGVKVANAAEVEVRSDALAWSLRAQRIQSDPTNIASELSRLKKVRVFVYRASWREDLRIAAYVPSLRRALRFKLDTDVREFYHLTARFSGPRLALLASAAERRC